MKLVFHSLSTTHGSLCCHLLFDSFAEPHKISIPALAATCSNTVKLGMLSCCKELLLVAKFPTWFGGSRSFGLSLALKVFRCGLGFDLATELILQHGW